MQDCRNLKEIAAAIRYPDQFAAGRLAGIREAAEIVKPVGKRPCDCEPWRCYCGKPDDAASVAAWDHAEGLHAAILALAEREPQG